MEKQNNRTKQNETKGILFDLWEIALRRLYLSSCRCLNAYVYIYYLYVYIYIYIGIVIVLNDIPLLIDELFLLGQTSQPFFDNVSFQLFLLLFKGFELYVNHWKNPFKGNKLEET